MSLRPMKNITKLSWDMIPMTDTVIDQVNLLGKYQQELLVFTDNKAQLIGYGDLNLTGLYGDGYENEIPLKIENENNIDYQEDQEEFHANQEDQKLFKNPSK